MTAPLGARRLRPTARPATPASRSSIDWQDCANFPDGDPRKTLEFMHRQMNEEMDATECSARSIADFPDAPWEVRMFLARQCADEARHALIFRKLFQSRGRQARRISGHEFPVPDHLQDSDAGGSLGGAEPHLRGRGDRRDRLSASTRPAAQGDDELAEFFDGQFADEIMHVRCANEFLHEMIAKEPRLALRVATALTEATRAFGEVFGGDGTAVAKYTISEQGRLEAGFRPEEVEIANRLAEERRDRAQAST